MNTEALRESVKNVVAESIKTKLEEATAQRLSIFEEKDEEDEDDKNEDGVDDDEPVVAENDKDGECDDDKKKRAYMGIGYGDDDDEDGEGEGGFEGGVSESFNAMLAEALKVTAMPSSERSKGTKGKAEEIEVKDLRELTKLAKTGKYDYFTVTKKNGDEDEYHVDSGKLVLM